MYFDEGRVLKQSHYKHSEAGVPPSTPLKPARPMQRHPRADQPSAEVRDLHTASMLDSANNKLQELMQLLYLLSRDPAVPKDARYHVTVAQGEIALLAHVMRNSTQEQATEAAPPADGSKSYCAACP